jgi:hypothetical protein
VNIVALCRVLERLASACGVLLHGELPLSSLFPLYFYSLFFVFCLLFFGFLSFRRLCQTGCPDRAGLSHSGKERSGAETATKYNQLRRAVSCLSERKFPGV